MEGSAIDVDPDLARRSALIRAAGGAARAVLDLFWPPVCAHCAAATAGPDLLCASCWARLSHIERPFCERLGAPFAVDIGGPLLSPEAIANPPVFARARAAVRYDEIARALARRLKYGDEAHLAATLAGLMVRAGGELIAEADFIVPIPLHRARLWARRYNQAAVLATEIARRSGKSLGLSTLVRHRRTASQVGLSRAERAANVAGAFRACDSDRPFIVGRRMLLVDDNFTTGATLNAAAAALLRAGASAVDALTFARAAPDP